MRISPKSALYASIAIIVGGIVLLGYFVELPILSDLREDLLQWAVILTGVALIVGVLNLLSVHWNRIMTSQPGSAYSIVLVVSLFLTLIVAGFFGPTSDYSLWIYNYIQIPVEASLMALLAVVLVYAAARLSTRRMNVYTLIFILTVLLVIFGIVTLPIIEVPGLKELSVWVTQVWAVAGARGIILGVALGTVATGLRVLMGADRPYGG